MNFGTAAIIVASLIFGLIPSTNKYVLTHGFTEESALSCQFILMTLCSFLCARFRRETIRLPLKETVSLMILGTVGMGLTDLCLNKSYLLIPVSLSVMLHFLYPVIVLIIMWSVFHHNMSRSMLLAVILSLTGLVLVSEFNGSKHLTGMLFAVGSAVCYACFSIANDIGKINRYPLMVRLFYMSLCPAVIYTVSSGARGELLTPKEPGAMAVMILFISFGSFLAFYLITAGIQAIGAERASFLNMLEPIVGIIASLILFHEPYSSKTIFGCLCVILSVFLISRDSTISSSDRVRFSDKIKE